MHKATMHRGDGALPLVTINIVMGVDMGRPLGVNPEKSMTYIKSSRYIDAFRLQIIRFQV